MTTQIDFDEDMTATLAHEPACVERIAFLWREADVLPHYPASTETAAELLRVGAGYDASVSLVEQWARDKRVEGVGIRGGRFQWTARSILGAMLLCETGRRYAPLDRRHLHKLSAAELVEMQARLAGQSAFVDLAAFDVNQICEIIAQCGDADMRRVFVTALKAKLRHLDGGILDK